MNLERRVSHLISSTVNLRLIVVKPIASAWPGWPHLKVPVDVLLSVNILHSGSCLSSNAQTLLPSLGVRRRLGVLLVNPICQSFGLT